MAIEEYKELACGFVIFEDASVGGRAGKSAGYKVAAIVTRAHTRKTLLEAGADIVVESWGEISIEQLEALF